MYFILFPIIFLLQHLEHVIKSRIPGIQSLINKSINDLESELSRLGKPVAADAGVSKLSKIFLRMRLDCL